MNGVFQGELYGERNASSSAASVMSISNSRTRLLISEPVREWRDDVLARLNKLCALPKGWDGYHGIPVNFENANFALRMLESCCRSDTPTPQIVPGSQGDLQIEWHLANGDIELHVRAPYDVHAWKIDERNGPDGEEMLLTNDFTIVAQWIKDLVESASAVKAAAA